MSAYDFTDTLAVQILTYKKEHNETAAQFAKGCGVSANCAWKGWTRLKPRSGYT